jgi:hypothetical protein
MGDRKCPLNEVQVPNTRAVRIALGTGYDRVEGSRRASRNGLVSDLPPEIPIVTIRQLFHRCTAGVPAAGDGAGDSALGRVGDPPCSM